MLVHHPVRRWVNTNISFSPALLSLKPGLFFRKLAALLFGGIGGVHHTVDISGAGIRIAMALVTSCEADCSDMMNKVQMDL